MMKRSGLQARQLGGQGPYSSLALRTAPVVVSTPPPGPTVVPAAAATSSSLEAAAPLADIIIRGNNSTSSIISLKESHHQTTTFESAAAAEISSNCSKAVESYHCGVSPPKVKTPALLSWRWNCFMPWESSYTADVSIDMEKHQHYSSPKNFTDKLAYYTVQTLKIPVNFFFQRRHISHAILLETVAAIPGMVGAMLLHLKSLRRFEHSGGWIKALLEESENERMHLMTFVELVKPKRYEQVLVIAIQCAFFIAYFLAYVVSPKLAHRLTGYIEEEAVIFYTEFLKDIDNGSFGNMPAPRIAIDYWRLPHDSTLRDVVVVIRADQARHRDLNHYASDIYWQEHELKEAPLTQLDTTYNKFKLHEFNE